MTSEEIKNLILKMEKERRINGTGEISKMGTPVDAVESGKRVRLDAIKRQMNKSSAELKAYEEIDPLYERIRENRKIVDEINKNARKVNVNRSQFYDGRYRDYSSVEPIYDEAEQAKLTKAKKDITQSHVEINKVRDKIGKIARSIPNKTMGVAGDALFAEKFINADAYDTEGGLYRSWDTVPIDGQLFSTQSVQGMMNQAMANDDEYERNKEFNVEAAKLRELIRSNPDLANEFINRYNK